MKKIILSVAFVLGCLTIANAQETNSRQNALGLKICDRITSVSFQRYLSSANRLELNLGYDRRSIRGDGNHIFGNSLFEVSALYQWVWQLSPGLKWYIGAGIDSFFGDTMWYYLGPPGADGLPTYKAGRPTSIRELRALGNIGIEYSFRNFPLQLAIDYKPRVLLLKRYADPWGYSVVEHSLSFAERWRF